MVLAKRLQNRTVPRFPFRAVANENRKGAKMKRIATIAISIIVIVAIPHAGISAELLPCKLTPFFKVAETLSESPEILEGLDEETRTWYEIFKSSPGAWCASEHSDPVTGRYCFAAHYDGMGNGIGIFPEPAWPGGPLITFNGLWMNSPDGVPRYTVSAGGKTFEADANRSPDLFVNDALSFQGFMLPNHEQRLLADLWTNGIISFSTNDVMAEVSTKGLQEALLHCRMYNSGG